MYTKAVTLNKETSVLPQLAVPSPARPTSEMKLRRTVADPSALR